MTQQTHYYAGFWIRLAAYIIDGIIISIPSMIINSVVTGIFIDQLAGMLVGGLVSILVGWIYFAGMESSRHMATIGKQAFNLRVTDVNGYKISFGRASARFFGKILSAVILYIGFIMIAFTRNKQALHDKIAHTFVVKTKKA